MQQLPIAPPAPDPHGPEGAVPDEAALRSELAKWRERVPKLASALRQRTDEVQRLEREVEALRRGMDGAAIQPADQPAGAGARARESLIAELEARLDDLKERYKSAQAELHKRQLDIDELRAEAEGWKQKWQAVTRELDQQEATAAGSRQQIDRLEAEVRSLGARCAELSERHAGHDQALADAQAECGSLRQRNEQLFETTEVANRQIESLTDSLAELRQSRQQDRERADTAEAQAAEARAAQVRADEALAGVRAEAEAATQALRSSEAALREENERLAGVVRDAQHTVEERELERRALSEQIQALEARKQHLDDQLAERSALVVTLEQDASAAAVELSRLREEREELEAARLRAERHAKENAEHVAQLDAKLERQQELMADLERELADAHRVQTEARRPAAVDGNDKDADIARLQQQIRKLEQTVRERTEKINQLEWQCRLAVSDVDQAVSAPGAARVEADNKLLVVLNQQLADARTQNGELLDRIRALEAEGGRGREVEDELMRIHGVGQKLAEQLHALGIHRLQQIAELDEADLDDSDHVLHAHRGRIVRDRWIEQAAALTRH
jgi:predicted flap endonuclease-1-like 5' DNA nuclease/predicted  nucleic acid-binding Zn-ribbon protein